jgi:hypothetical protein
MNRFGVIGTTALFLLAGFAAPAGAHQQEQEKPQKHEKPAKDQKQQGQAKPQEQQQGQAKPHSQQQQQAKTHQNQQQQQQQAKTHQNQQQQQQQVKTHQNEQQQQRQVKSYQDQPQQQQAREQQSQPRRQPVAWQNQRATNWQSQHRTWQQRGGYNGYRIPTNNYNEYYGQNHAFRINTLRVVYVGSYPRFQYGGFWFGLVDPWPQYWSNNWYDNDDMYIAYYGDGYYLCNRAYPRDRIAISIYVN